jgi:hypothetical protein
VVGRKDTSGYAVGGVTNIITGLVTDSEIISKCSSAKRRLGKEVPEFFFLHERLVSECEENILVHLLQWRRRKQRGSGSGQETRAPNMAPFSRMAFATCPPPLLLLQTLNVRVCDDMLPVIKDDCVNEI